MWASLFPTTHPEILTLISKPRFSALSSWIFFQSQAFCPSFPKSDYLIVFSFLGDFFCKSTQSPKRVLCFLFFFNFPLSVVSCPLPPTCFFTLPSWNWSLSPSLCLVGVETVWDLKSCSEVNWNALSHVSTLWVFMDCSLPGYSVHGILQARKMGVGCHFLLQGFFPTQESNPGLSHCRRILY